MQCGHKAIKLAKLCPPQHSGEKWGGAHQQGRLSRRASTSHQLGGALGAAQKAASTLQGTSGGRRCAGVWFLALACCPCPHIPYRQRRLLPTARCASGALPRATLAEQARGRADFPPKPACLKGLRLEYPRAPELGLPLRAGAQCGSAQNTRARSCAAARW